MRLIPMMAINLPSTRDITIRDFVEDDGVFVYTNGSHKILFYEQYGGWSRKIVEVWYAEADKEYKKEHKEFITKSQMTKWEIKDINRRVWWWINKFKKMYCHE